jgi:hypothetical protein
MGLDKTGWWSSHACSWSWRERWSSADTAWWGAARTKLRDPEVDVPPAQHEEQERDRAQCGPRKKQEDAMVVNHMWDLLREEDYRRDMRRREAAAKHRGTVRGGANDSKRPG